MLKINYDIKHFPKFILRRSIRIDIVYITAILLTLVSFWLLNEFSLFNGKVIAFNIWQFLAHLFYYVPFTKYEFYNHIFWTLGIEFQFYILIGLFYFLNNKTIYRVGFLILFASCSFLNFLNGYYLLSTYSLFFAIGITTLHYHNSKQKIYLLLMALFLSLIFYKFDYISGFLILFSIITVQYYTRKIKFLNFLGNISYSLYIIHPLIFIFSVGIFKRIAPRLFNSEIVLLMVNLAIAIMGSYIFYILVEKPAIKLSKKISVN